MLRRVPAAAVRVGAQIRAQTCSTTNTTTVTTTAAGTSSSPARSPHPAQVLPIHIGNASGAMFKYMCEKASPFIKDALEIKLVSAKEKGLVMKMRLHKKYWLRRSSRSQAPQTHSGLLAAAIDHAGGMAGFTALTV
jgi:hypothetical protein